MAFRLSRLSMPSRWEFWFCARGGIEFALYGQDHYKVPIMFSMVTSSLNNTKIELEIVVLLGQRYGDGLVYLRGGNDRILLKRAIEFEFINEEGYLTPAGYRYWQSQQN